MPGANSDIVVFSNVLSAYVCSKNTQPHESYERMREFMPQMMNSRNMCETFLTHIHCKISNQYTINVQISSIRQSYICASQQRVMRK